MSGGLEFDEEHDDALRRAAQPSSPHHRNDHLAGWWIRVGAYLIDIVVLLIGLAIIVAIGLAIGGIVGTILIILAFAVYFLGYWVYFEGGETGQTIGKRAVGIRVVDQDGNRAGYGKAFGRNLVARVIALLPIIGLVDVLWPLWDDRKQCLHDKAGSTIVVHTH
jgi:uncharacterized RDD family membrane protein YckC